MAVGYGGIPSKSEHKPKPVSELANEVNQEVNRTEQRRKDLDSGAAETRLSRTQRQAEENQAIARKNMFSDMKKREEGVKGINVGINRNDIRDVSANTGSQFTSTQRRLAEALEKQAAGQGPSLAQQQLKVGGDRALAQQLAMAAQSRTPGQGALAQRLAMRQQGEIAQNQAAQSGLLRLQEQNQAQQLLGNVAGQARGQDLQGAGLDLQAALANQGMDFNARQSTVDNLLNQQNQLNNLLANKGNFINQVQSQTNQQNQFAAGQAQDRAFERDRVNNARNAGIAGAAGTILSTFG